MIVALPADLQARIKDQVPGLYQRVQLAADLAAVFEKGVLPLQMPAGFVLWSGDRARPNERANWVDQEVTTTVSLVLVGKRAGDVTAGKAGEDLGAIADLSIAAVVGWQAPGMDAPFEYAGGKLIGIQSGALFIQLDFATRRHVRAT